MMNKRFNNWLPVALSLLISSLLFAGCMDSEGEKTLNTLRQLAAQTPVYSGFSQISSTHVIKNGRGTLALFYQSPASYSEVRAFYIKELTAKGWRVDEERTYGGNTVGITFRKGEYSIVVYHSSPRDQSWDYAVDYRWERP
jgi:hypothetical protein